VRWTWWDWSLSLGPLLPSVFWHCWLGHLTRKTRPRNTYNVFSGTLNPTHFTSLQCRKVWLTPTTTCRAVTLPKRETSWNLVGCPKLTKRSQPLVGRSSPYYEDIWRTYCCLTSFFPIVDTCLSCEDIAQQSCAMVPIRRFFVTFLRPVFPASRMQHISDLHSKFALGPHHV